VLRKDCCGQFYIINNLSHVAYRLFKIKSDVKPARRQLVLESTGGSIIQNTEDELLGLCSGVFTEGEYN